MKQSYKNILLIAGDITWLFIALIITIFAKQNFELDLNYLNKHILPFSFIFPIWNVTYYVEGMYSLRTFNPNGLTVSLVRSQIINLTLGILFFYIFDFDGITPKTNLFIILIISSIFLFVWRKIFFKFFSMRTLKLKTYIVANARKTEEVKAKLEELPYLGFEIIGVDNTSPNITLDIDLIVIDKTETASGINLSELLKRINKKTKIIDITLFSELVTGRIPVDCINEFWIIENCGLGTSNTYAVTKNVIDKLFATILILLSIPLFIFLVPILLIISGRPLLYSQKRVGLDQKEFNIYKLRTMINNAEKDGAKWATPNDNRITPIGKILRKTRIDELPQLYNILRGEMSFVGPRPERPEIINNSLSKIPFYEYRHLVLPGVTGWAQVNFRYGYTELDSLTKLQLDFYYLKNKSIWLDIKIILKTIKTVITGVGH